MRETPFRTLETTGNAREHSAIVADRLDLESENNDTRAGIARVLGTGIGTRLIRIIALGALLVGAASLYMSISQRESDSIPVGYQPAQVAAESLDLASAGPDLAELPYDELSKYFFGAGPSDRARPFFIDHDAAELPYDELSRNFIGIPIAGK